MNFQLIFYLKIEAHVRFSPFPRKISARVMQSGSLFRWTWGTTWRRWHLPQIPPLPPPFLTLRLPWPLTLAWILPAPSGRPMCSMWLRGRWHPAWCSGEYNRSSPFCTGYYDNRGSFLKFLESKNLFLKVNTTEVAMFVQIATIKEAVSTVNTTELVTSSGFCREREWKGGFYQVHTTEK